MFNWVVAELNKILCKVDLSFYENVGFLESERLRNSEAELVHYVFGIEVIYLIWGLR